MASAKAERPVGTQLFGQAKKEPAKAGEGPTKAAASKNAVNKSKASATEPAPKKGAAQTKKKGKGGKAAAK